MKFAHLGGNSPECAHEAQSNEICALGGQFQGMWGEGPQQ
jgi:hypothetical protein